MLCLAVKWLIKGLCEPRLQEPFIILGDPVLQYPSRIRLQKIRCLFETEIAPVTCHVCSSEARNNH